jgi:hypothetical protein
MTIREAFLQAYPDGDNLEPHCYSFFRAGYEAAIEEIKKHFTICEKKPCSRINDLGEPLYREAKL